MIGNGNYIMTHVHIGHDCVVGNRVVLTHGAGLSGFVEIEDGAVIGGLAGLHQFVRVGALAMIGGCARVTQDVPPYMLVSGHPARVYGLNSVGLRRSGFEPHVRRELRQAFQLLYRSGLNTSQALKRIEAELTCQPVVHLVEFVRKSRRGIIPGPRTRGAWAEEGSESLEGDLEL